MARKRISAPENEAALLAAARAGDQGAFSTLYRQQIQYVRGIARRMLPHDEVDDLCQEVFLLAFTRLPGFAEACSFRTWISRITVYACLGQRRRFQQASNGGCHLTPLPDSLAAEDQGLGRVAARLDLEHMLRALNTAQREVLDMAYVEEMPAAEIASSLGITVAQVKHTLRRAKALARRNS